MLEHGPGLLVLADGRRLGADSIVLAAGTGLSAIDGLAGAGLPSLRPVKGAHPAPRVAGHSAAGAAARPDPRAAGGTGGRCPGAALADGLVVGAPRSRSGARTPLCGRAPCTSCWRARGGYRAGRRRARAARGRHRPAAPSPDNMPRIGRTTLDGVIAAVGHYRNGILLAPFTAAAVVDLVARRRVAPLIEALAPA